MDSLTKNFSKPAVQEASLVTHNDLNNAESTINKCQTEKELGETVGEIVRENMRNAEIFKKYGIDFCCGGKQLLQKVCEEKGIDLAIIRGDLDNAQGTPTSATLNYAAWSPGFLADFIFNQHHTFFYREDPEIKEILQKVVDHHSVNHPFLIELLKVYQLLSQELYAHFIKEEQILFPFINTLEQVKLTNKKNLLATISPLSGPLHMMEVDHEEAGTALGRLRKITNEYTVPADACNSFQLLYKKLADLEADLHLHIHLENNILFPAAIKLEKEVIT